ncbi:MBL fold metallo-hydrolase [Changchengzhania lutea]|uniref:MBL fold metallo-hydrolase n=1 Tax=Changchengzhania lutea TaxID=2049305 RepID=UPI00115DE409|nr:MBL fold metallo-hydrolase [Changchengzhania lutea]
MALYKTLARIFMFTMVLQACGQNDNITIKTTQLSNHVYMLEGQGGNIGLSVGDDGVLIIDDQFARLTPKILAAIKKISAKPIRFVANTHHHGDHTGGNANLAEAGATIIAHDNVRSRLETDKEKDMLPVITFNDKLSLFINNERVLVFHLDNAHTDGDSMLYFTESNVLHTGDVFFSNRYPYIDLTSKGSVDGYIEAVKVGLMTIDEDTKIIPGHGQLSNKAEYEIFLKMMETLKNNILAEINNGASEEDVASNETLTKTYDDLGYSWNFITSEKIRRTFYKSLKK